MSGNFSWDFEFVLPSKNQLHADDDDDDADSDTDSKEPKVWGPFNDHKSLHVLHCMEISTFDHSRKT